MGKALYIGSNIGSASGYTRRYFSEFLDARGILFRVEILDNVSGTGGFNFSVNNGPTEFDLGRDGVTISWDGQDDNLHESVIGSSLTMDFLLAGTRHWIFTDVLAGSEEDRFLVALFRFEATPQSTIDDPDGVFRPEWFGTLVPEGIEYISNEANEFLRLTATDGLASLNDIPYQNDNGTPYTTDGSLAVHLGRVLDKLPTSSLWSFGSSEDLTLTAALANNETTDVYFVREVPFMGSEAQLTAVQNVPSAYSTLSSVRAKAAAFYEVDTQTDAFGGSFITKTTSTCGQVLEQILQVLNLSIFQSEGSFWIMNWRAIDDANPLQHRFKSVSHFASRAANTIGHTTTDWNFDLSGNAYEAVRGLSTRYLFPIKTAVSVHKKGGAQILVSGNTNASDAEDFAAGFEPNVYNIKHETASASEITNLISETGSVQGGDSPLLTGHVRGIRTGFAGANSIDLASVGMKTILIFTIKIGDYYLKRNLKAFSDSSSDEVNIHRTAATDFGYMDLVQDGDVEWTLTPSTYRIVTPFVGMSEGQYNGPEPPVVLQGDDDEIQRVGGYHLELRDNETEFRFFQGLSGQGGTTDGGSASFALDWALPPLPDNVAEHVGVEFKCVVRYKSRNNATIVPPGELSYDLGLGHPNGGRIVDFKMFSSSGSGEDDVIFTASGSANRAVVKCAETILGDQYTDADSIGALKYYDFADSTFKVSGDDTWTTSADTTETFHVHELLARECLKERSKVRRRISGSFIFDPAKRSSDVLTAGALTNERPSFRNAFGYTIGAATRYYFASSMTWSVRPSAFDFEGFLIDVDVTIQPLEEEDTKGRGGTGGSGGSGGGSGGYGTGIGFTHGGGTPGGTPGALLQLKSQTSGTGTGSLTAAQTAKLAAITLDGSNNIESFSVSTGVYPLDTNNIHPAFTFNVSDELTALTIAAGVTLLTAAQIDDSAGTTQKFATSAQLTAIGNNTSSISSLTSLFNGVNSRLTTAEGDIDTLETDVDTLEGQVTAIRRVLQDVNSGGGKGVYFTDTKLTSNAHLAVQDKRAILFAGSNTGVNIQETSPGTITLSVQAGSTGSEVQVDAITITGSSAFQNATISIAQPVTFTSSTSGITTSNVTEGSKLFHTAARVDARIAAANVTDLVDVTDAGSGAIMTSAERTKLSGIETGAEVNVVTTNLGSANQVLTGTRTIFFDGNDLKFATGDGTGSTITELHYDADGAQGTGIFRFGARVEFQDVVNFRGAGGTSQSQIRFVEPPMGGSSAVVLKGPSTNLSADLIFTLPDSDGSAGQFLKTDGSGNLSFASASGGGSASYVLASTSTRVPMFYASRYYFGSSSFGWDTDTGYSTSQTSATSVADDFAHMGIVAPTAISTLKIFATLRNDTSADDVSLYVYKGSRPNGSSSSISLTELIDIDIDVTQDRHHNADATATSAGISEGDLIFVAFKRAGSNGTKFVNASYTLHATP